MNGQMPNSNKYEMSLKHMMEPVLPSQLPEIKMDMAGLSRYAKERGISLSELTVEEQKKENPVDRAFVLNSQMVSAFFERKAKTSLDAIERFEKRKDRTGKKASKKK